MPYPNAGLSYAILLSMSRILLVRHGHVEGIDPERFRGREDVPLTAIGRQQAHSAAAFIAGRWKPVIVYTSPLQRCIETGQEIASACSVSPQVLDGLNDIDYGLWQWKTHVEVQAQWPDLLQRWLTAPHLVRFPEGESLQDLMARLTDVLRMLLEHHANDTVVLVGHYSGIRTLLLQALDQPLSAYWHLTHDPGGVSELTLATDGIRAIRINQTPIAANPAAPSSGHTA
jgi:broad specificity phosphatase PhoE